MTDLQTLAAKLPASPTCKECGTALEFDHGATGGLEEPPTQATWYCPRCGIDYPSETAEPVNTRHAFDALVLEVAKLKGENQRLRQCAFSEQEWNAFQRLRQRCRHLNTVRGYCYECGLDMEPETRKAEKP